MENLFILHAQTILTILIPAFIACGIVITGFLIRKFVFKRLERWSRNTKTEIDNIILAAIRISWIY